MSAIILFEEKQVRRAWNADEEKWYFAIVDIIAILTGSPNPQVYWRVMKKRLRDEGNQTVTKCNALKMTAPDGKQRLTDVADTEQKKKDAQGFPQNQQAARVGGAIAGNARRELEAASGTRVSAKTNFKELPEARTRTLGNKKPHE